MMDVDLHHDLLTDMVLEKTLEKASLYLYRGFYKGHLHIYTKRGHPKHRIRQIEHSEWKMCYSWNLYEMKDCFGNILSLKTKLTTVKYQSHKSYML